MAGRKKMKIVKCLMNKYSKYSPNLLSYFYPHPIKSAANRGEAGETIFKEPEKEYERFPLEEHATFGRARDACVVLPSPERSSINRRWSLAASSARRCPCARVLMSFSLLCNSPLICNANCAFSRKMRIIDQCELLRGSSEDWRSQFVLPVSSSICLARPHCIFI